MENHLQYLPGRSEPFTMIAVKGGRFDMGGESRTDSSLPIHPVELDDFFIGQYLVTQELWANVMLKVIENIPYYFKGENRPVIFVSWDMIVNDFLPRLNQITEKKRPSDTIYRLPTEAEWEYAARGGIHYKEAPYIFSGSNILDEVGWYDKNSHNETKSVGLKLPNLLNIYDMSGNVWEWCLDWYDKHYYYKCLSERLISNPTGMKVGTHCVYRGGGYLHDLEGCKVVYRFNGKPSYQSEVIGFRLVLSPLPIPLAYLL